MSKDWTEDDEIRLHDDIKKHAEKRIKKVLEKAEKKYINLEANYNCTGSTSTYRSMQYYNDLMDICRLALQAINKACLHCESHKRTAANFVKKYRDAKAANMTDILNFDDVICDFQQCIWN